MVSAAGGVLIPRDKTGTVNLAEVQTPVTISALVFVLVALFVVTAVWCRKRRFISVCHSNSNNSMLPKQNTYDKNLVGQNDPLYEQIYSKEDVKDSVKDLEETNVMTLYGTKDTHISSTDDTCINHLNEPEYHIDAQSGISDKSCTGSIKDNTYKQVTTMSKTTDYSTSCHDCKFSNQGVTYFSNRNSKSEHVCADNQHRSRTSKVAGVESKERYNKRINNNKQDKVSINILTSSTKKTDNVVLLETEQKIIAGKPQNYSEHHNLKSTKVSTYYNDTSNDENKTFTTNSSSTMFQTKNVTKEDNKVQTSFVEELQVIEDDQRDDTSDVLTTKNIIYGDKNFRRNDKNVAKIKPFVRQNTGSSSDDSEYRLLNTNPVNNDECSKVATSRAPRPVDSESMSSSWSIENTSNQENDGSEYEIESYLIATEMCPPVDSFEFASANQNDNEDVH